MSTTFNRTRNQMATLVLKKLGVVASGGTAASADMEDVYEAIDLRLKEIHKLGIFWRKVDETALSISLTANQSSASATVDILFPISMTVVDGSLDQPVDIIGRVEYAALENKAEQGTPTKALWKGSAEFLFHPVQTAATTANLIYEKIADDTADATAPDVEQSMMRSLATIVAYDVGDEYGIPEQKMMRWKGEAAQAERDIRKLGAERKAYSRVAVDDFDDRPTRTESDYGM